MFESRDTDLNTRSTSASRQHTHNVWPMSVPKAAAVSAIPAALNPDPRAPTRPSPAQSFALQPQITVATGLIGHRKTTALVRAVSYRVLSALPSRVVCRRS